MKQNLAKNFFKEHRFVFQQGESEKTAPTDTPKSVPSTAPPAAEPTAEKPPETKPGETPTAPAATPGSPETPAKPEAPKAPEAAVKTAVEKVTTSTSKQIDRAKLELEINKGLSEFVQLMVVGPKDFSPRSKIESLAELDFKTLTTQMIAELETTFNDKFKTQQETLKTWLEKIGGGTQEEFVQIFAAKQAQSFTKKLGNMMEKPAYQYLKAFAEKPENRGKDLMYTVSFDKDGTPTKIEFGPTDLVTAYKTFHDAQENLKTSAQKAADALKVEGDRKAITDKITRIKSYPILKFLSPFLGLDTIDPATNKSGWDCVADGTHTIAMFALDFFGYPEGQGSIEGIASFLPGQTGANIKAAQKTFSAGTNKLSYAASQNVGQQPGAPATPGAPQAPNAPSKPVKPGEVPTTNQKKVGMTEFGEIIAKPALMPKTGIVFENAVATGTGGIPKVIQLNMSKGGRLILPGNSDLKIDGEQKVVEPGKTFAYGANSGKYNNGLITIEGRIDAGTVIDGQVTITNAALEDSK